MFATTQEVQDYAAKVRGQDNYTDPVAWGVGIKRTNFPKKSHIDAWPLDVWFPAVNWGENFITAALLAYRVGHINGNGAYNLSSMDFQHVLDQLKPYRSDGKPHPNIDLLDSLYNIRVSPQMTPLAIPQMAVFVTVDDLSKPPASVEEVYFRLHLLSFCKVKPNEQNLSGIFGKLPNVIWTNYGPIMPEEFDGIRMMLRTNGAHIQVFSQDKIPFMTNYVNPKGVRIADAARVRLGAYLAEGTTVMQEGFCNYNAGTLTAAMVEGRISQGVIVDGGDIGGGASIMGTLSGGGKEVISIGKRCLLGANSGLGISLGDDCIVEAGAYVTAGAKVRKPDGTFVKALDLSGQSGMLIRRNSTDGALEVIANNNAVELNPILHAN